MSDTSGGPGWWIASDGKWYPPHLHPSYQAPPATQAPSATPAPSPPQTASPAQSLPWQPEPAIPPTAGSGQAPSRLPRRPLVIGGVIAAALIVIGGLVAVVSGGGPSGYFADGTPPGHGFSCANALYLSWATSNGQIHGEAQTTISATAGTHLLTGTQSGNTVHLTVEGSTQTGELTRTALVLDESGGKFSITCPLTTHQHFLATAPRESPQGSSEPAVNRAAEADLTNAVVTAKAAYVNQQSYAPASQFMANLDSSSPYLNFTTGPASASAQISVAFAPSGQAIVMATRSGNGRCFYAADNESGPSVTGFGPYPIPSGTSYAASPADASQASCNASDPTPLAGAWQISFPS